MSFDREVKIHGHKCNCQKGGSKTWNLIFNWRVLGTWNALAEGKIVVQMLVTFKQYGCT